MIDQIAAALAGRQKIGVAVSGGADSVFLLTALRELGVASAVLHINHRLRGEESDADEEFVRSFAQNLGLPFHTASLPPDPGNIEQEARRARYAFFAECIAKGFCETVATGHTLDDQAETVLFRFMRGSGTAGLSGIRPSSETGIIRPLLTLRRTAIRAWLTEKGIAWREDTSNSSLEYDRNRIRINVLPQLVRLNPALPEVLASTADWARAEEEYWAAELDRFAPTLLHQAPETVFIRIEPLLHLPIAVQRRLLRRALAHVRGDLRAIGFHHIESIRALMSTREGSGRIQLPELDIYRSFDQLRITPQGFDARMERDFEIPLAVPGRTALPERMLTIETELTPPSPVYNSDLNDLDRIALESGGSLLLRNWRPGDQFEGAGHSGMVRIKTLFQEYRIPLWERRRWPVITMGESIVWTRRFGAASKFKATPESVSILRVTDFGGRDGIESAATDV